VYDPPNDFEWENLGISRLVHCIARNDDVLIERDGATPGHQFINDD
jgi:hypothetical protein